MTARVELEIKGEVEPLRLAPGDRVIVSLERKQSQEFVAELKEQLRAIFPDNQVVVLPLGLRISREQA